MGAGKGDISDSNEMGLLFWDERGRKADFSVLPKEGKRGAFP